MGMYGFVGVNSSEQVRVVMPRLLLQIQLYGVYFNLRQDFFLGIFGESTVRVGISVEMETQKTKSR